MPSPAYELKDRGDHCYIVQGASPTGERLEAPCVFRAPRPWYERRADNDWIQPISEGEYARRKAAETTEGDTPDSVADKAELAREYVDEAIPTLADELPEERPTDEADAAVRILYELLEADDYNARRSVLADVSEYPARGGSEIVERRLYAELYDRHLAEG